MEWFVNTDKSTGGHTTFSQGGDVDYVDYPSVPVTISSGEAEYISATFICMRDSH